MEEAIKNFPKQFLYEPIVENTDKFKKPERLIIAGMGGSALPGELLKALHPLIEITLQRDYDLPHLSPEALKKSTVIANSYSGNTEETIDALEKALAEKLTAVVVATGGKLLEKAEELSIPYIQIPDTGIQPRMALGFSIRALLKICGDEKLLKETGELATLLNPESLMEDGAALAKTLHGRMPIIYASTENKAIAHNWKIKFNETGKIPAFYNVFPELNHNEMTGFDMKDSTQKLGDSFHFLFLEDDTDNSRVKRRMEITEKLLRDRNLPVTTIRLEGDSPLQKIFASLILADWTALHTAKLYGVEPEHVPMVEEFKKAIAS